MKYYKNHPSVDVMLAWGNKFLESVAPEFCKPKIIRGTKMLIGVRSVDSWTILMEAREFPTNERFFRRFADAYDLLNRGLERGWMESALHKTHERRGVLWSLSLGGKKFSKTNAATGVQLCGRLVAIPKKRVWREIKMFVSPIRS